MILAILAKDMKEKGILKNDTVVGTIMTNYGLEQFLENIGVRLERVNVGDKYIVKRMLENGFNLGGEQSGHIILSDLNTTGDGIITALAVLSIMKESKKSLSYLHKDYKKVPEKTVNITVSSKPPINDIKELQDAIEKAKKIIGKGRVVVRYSGTEPLLRITVESQDSKKVNECINIIAEAAKKNLS
jgi:phosphoglucosamine mutase